MAREVMRFDGEEPSDSETERVRKPATQKAKGQPKQVKDISKLFVDKQGDSLQFCVEAGEALSEEDIERLKNTIKKYGGIVVSHYRNANYVLVDPATQQGGDFISMHSTPTRHVVSTLFIQESIKRRSLVPNEELNLFIKEDRPVVFYLHDSLDQREINKLREDINLRGGNPDGKNRVAQIAIHSPDWTQGQSLRAKSKKLRRTETPQWLMDCMERKRFTLGIDIAGIHRNVTKPGRKPGAPRNEYTKEDDLHLVAWMATTFGTSKAGRAGNRAYKDMCEMHEHEHWSHAHTWHSWRERYKNKKKLLDPLIEAYIQEHGTTQPYEGEPAEEPPIPNVSDAQGPYLVPRKPKKKANAKARDKDKNENKKGNKKKGKGEEEEEDEDGEEEEDEPSGGSHDSNESYRPEKGKGKRKARREDEEDEEDEAKAPPQTRKRARIDAEQPRTIKISVSQTAQLSQKPSVSSQKSKPASQKPGSAAQESGPSSQKPDPVSRKPSSSSRKPSSLSQKPSSSTQKPDPSTEELSSSTEESGSSPEKESSRRKSRPSLSKTSQEPSTPSSSPPPTPPRHSTPVPTPPPASRDPNKLRLGPTQSAATSAATSATVLESQEQSMNSNASFDEPYAIDPALSSTWAQDMQKDQQAVADRFKEAELSKAGDKDDDEEVPETVPDTLDEEEEEEDEKGGATEKGEDEDEIEEDEDEEDVEVGGISQFPAQSDDEDVFSDNVRERLDEIAKKFRVSTSIVKAQYMQAQVEFADSDESELLDLTRDGVEEFVAKLRA